MMNKKKIIYICLIVACIILILMLWTMIHLVPLRENLDQGIAHPVDPNMGIVMNEKTPPQDPYLNNNNNQQTSTNFISSIGHMVNSCFDNNTGNMTVECQNQINGFATNVSSITSSISSSITNMKKSDITGGLSTLSSPLA